MEHTTLLYIYLFSICLFIFAPNIPVHTKVYFVYSVFAILYIVYLYIIICIIRVSSYHYRSDALWSFCYKHKFLVCVNIPGKKAHSYCDSDTYNNWMMKNTYLLKTNLGCVNDVGSISFEEWVPFVFEHKCNISRNFLRCLITLFGEGDLCPFLPASLDNNVKDLVLCPHCPSIWVQSSASDSHPLGTSMEDLL